MEQKTLMVIYFALFHSILSYGIIDWGGLYPTQMILLQRKQNKILKITQPHKKNESHVHWR